MFDSGSHPRAPESASALASPQSAASRPLLGARRPRTNKPRRFTEHLRHAPQFKPDPLAPVPEFPSVKVEAGEVVRPIPGHPRYYATSLGRIIGPKGHVLRPQPNAAGYPTVNVSAGTSRGATHQWRRPIHQLVLCAFVGPRPDGMGTRHLNDVKVDNRLENLCWGTPAENREDAVRNGRLPGPCRSMRKLRRPR